MPNQIVLSWDVDVTGTSFGTAAAVLALAGVDLYDNAITDPVLGQLFGLTVQSDVTGVANPTTARRVLSLNMNGVLTPTAPPPFPCHPRTSTPPLLAPLIPYPLVEAVTLAGSFFLNAGSNSVATTATQLPAINIGDSVQFLAQEGVFYEVSGVTGTTISLTAPYSGTSGNSEAFKEIAAPATIAAFYSTSDLDTAGVATVPAIPAGSGARTVRLVYNDSTGAGPFTVDTALTGRRPAAVTLAGGSIDIASIQNILVLTSGGFANSIGQITLVELTAPLPAIPPNATPGLGIGADEGDRTFFALTDAAQLLIGRKLVYLPPSYFAMAQQGASAPQLAGDFFVTTNSAYVPTTEDQTGVLASEYTIEFASQMGVLYFVLAVTPKIITLATPYTGLDDNFTGTYNVNSNAGTMGNIGTEVIKKVTGAFLVSPSPAAPPTNAELSTPLGQFVAMETASPPPNPPFLPGTVPVPTFLSGLFTRTFALKLAMPITTRTIAFA
jgi:hypothetical protein